MTTPSLEQTAQTLVAAGKGILAADESSSTIGKRFGAVGIPSTADTRRVYREMLFTTPGLSEVVSGVILYGETIRQADSGGARPAGRCLTGPGATGRPVSALQRVEEGDGRGAAAPAVRAR